MWPTNLAAGQRLDYVAALNAPATKTRVEVDLLNLDHKHIQSLDHEFDDGQVNFNRGADISRSLQAAFIDPSGDLLDLDLRYLLQIKHHLWVPSLSKWAITPVFTGRVVAPSSEGDVSKVEAHGKETFGLMPGAPRRKWNSGRRVVNVIRNMFEDIGETKFRISPGIRAELHADVQSGGRDPDKAPTRVARAIAGQHGLQVFWDELGYLVVRRPPKTPIVTWSEETDLTAAQERTMVPATSPIAFTRDLRNVRNVVVATGKKKLSYVASADRNHVFSPHSLTRGGRPGRLIEYWEAEASSATSTRPRRPCLWVRAR
jgi:hypothetical protein